MIITLVLFLILALVADAILLFSYFRLLKHTKEYLNRMREVESAMDECVKEVQYDIMELEKVVREMWNRI